MGKHKNLRNLAYGKNGPTIKDGPAVEFHIERTRKLTEKQKEFVEILMAKSSHCVFCNGFAGTGKSYLAVYSALRLLSEGSYDQILYIRSPQQTRGEDLGFLPGDQNEKMGYHYEILYDKMREFLSEEDYKKLFKEKLVDTRPTSFIRGANFANKIVIVDEAQNCSFETIYTLLTRIAEGSKIILLSDYTQKDVAEHHSGIEDIMKIFGDQDSRDNGIETFLFDEYSDIVRSGLVKFVIEKVDSHKRYL